MCRRNTLLERETLAHDFWQRFRFIDAAKAIYGSNCTLALVLKFGKTCSTPNAEDNFNGKTRISGITTIKGFMSID